MNDSERLTSANSTLLAGSAPVFANSSTRRAASNGPFSTQYAGLVDVFAQVFAQMSTPISPATSSASASPAFPQESSPSEMIDDRDLQESDADLHAKSTDGDSNNARDAVLIATAADSQRPVQPQASQLSVENAETEKPSNYLNAGNSIDSPATQNAQAETPTLASVATVQSNGESDDANSKTRSSSKKTLHDSSEAAGAPDAIAKPESTNEQASPVTSHSATEQVADSDRVDANSRETSTSLETGNDGDREDSRRFSRRESRNRDEPNGFERQSVEPRTESAVVESSNSVAAFAESTATSDSSLTSNGAATSSAPKPMVSAAAAVTASSNAAAPTTATGASNSATGSTSNEARSGVQPILNSPTSRSSAASKGSETTSNSASDAVTRAKLVQRVSRAFQHMGSDGGTVRLRLAPAELGSVRVEMQIHGRKVNARVVAETEAASMMLREHLPDLRARLEAQGMQVERIEVEMDENSFDPSKDSHQQHARDEERNQQRFRREPTTDAVAVSMKRSVSQSRPTISNDLSTVVAMAGVDIKL